MSEWKTVRLDELAAAEPSAISKPYGSAILKEDYVSTGIPVVRGINLSKGTFHDADFVFIPQRVADRMPGAQLTSGDLVVTHRGTVGQVSMIPRASNFDRYVASTSHVKVRLDPAKAVPEFYYYWFSSPRGRESILENVSTVGVPGLAQPVATVKRLLVPFPVVAEQRAIAEVLGALDDKIAANVRLSRTIDDYLESVFERLTRNSAPNQVALGTIAKVNESSARPRTGGRLRYIDIASVGVGRHETPQPMGWNEAPGRARRRVRKGDVMWSTVRPNRRSHSLNLSDDPLLVASTGLAILTPNGVSSAYLYEVAKSPDFSSQLESMAEGSAYPAVRAERFADVSVPLLDFADRHSFDAVADPLRFEQHCLTQENSTLAATRDALLPQLVSGKLRVREVEKKVEALV